MQRRDSRGAPSEGLNVGSIYSMAYLVSQAGWDDQHQGGVFAQFSALSIGCHDVSGVEEIGGGLDADTSALVEREQQDEYGGIPLQLLLLAHRRDVVVVRGGEVLAAYGFDIRVSSR